MRLRILPWVAVAIFVIAIHDSCKKDDGLVFSDIPEISIESIEPISIEQFKDSIVIRLQYRDGTGDLGFEHPDSFSLRVLDSRLTAPDWYFVPPLSPIGSNVPIQGILKFKLNGTFLIGGTSTETTTFTIRIKDRNNNWSNEVVTPTISITP